MTPLKQNAAANQREFINLAFTQKLSWASQLGIWPYETVAHVFGVSLNVVKNAGTGRGWFYRDHTSLIRMGPYWFAKQYIPGELHEMLNKGEQVSRTLLEAPATDPPNRFDILDLWVRRIKDKPESKPKFNDLIRNGILLEATRVQSNGELQWWADDFAAAFGLTKGSIHALRGGAIGAEFHRKFREARTEYVRSEYGDDMLPVLDAPVAEFTNAVKYEHDLLSDDQEPGAVRRAQAALASSQYATEALSDEYRHQLVFDALQYSERYADAQDVLAKLHRRMRPGQGFRLDGRIRDYE